MKQILGFIILICLLLSLDACLKGPGKGLANGAENPSSVAKNDNKEDLDLRVNIKISVKTQSKVAEAILPFDLRQDSFEAYQQESWMENKTESSYGKLPYHVLFDGILGQDGVEIYQSPLGQTLRLLPATAISPFHTHASLVTTSLKQPVPANFFWFELDMTTLRQLREEPNPWERGWLVWNLQENHDASLPEIVREVVPYTFYYFYVKETDGAFLGLEVGKIEPSNSLTWDCAYDVSPEIASATIDCDNDGEVDDVIYGAQRFFPFRFEASEPAHETGDCLVQAVLPRRGFGVGSKQTFRVLHHQNSFEIYWIRRNLDGQMFSQKLLSCQDRLNPYSKGGVGFYTEDAEVLIDNFKLQAFELASLELPQSAYSIADLKLEPDVGETEKSPALPRLPNTGPF